VFDALYPQSRFDTRKADELCKRYPVIEQYRNADMLVLGIYLDLENYYNICVRTRLIYYLLVIEIPDVSDVACDYHAEHAIMAVRAAWDRIAQFLNIRYRLGLQPLRRRKEPKTLVSIDSVARKLRKKREIDGYLEGLLSYVESPDFREFAKIRNSIAHYRNLSSQVSTDVELLSLSDGTQQIQATVSVGSFDSDHETLAPKIASGGDHLVQAIYSLGSIMANSVKPSRG
jgi:hypothetical protein